MYVAHWTVQLGESSKVEEKHEDKGLEQASP